MDGFVNQVMFASVCFCFGPTAASPCWVFPLTHTSTGHAQVM